MISRLARSSPWHNFAIFSKYNVKLLKNNELIIECTRMPNGLWSLPFASNTSPQQVNGILRTDKPKQEFATYLHAALGSPAPSTLLRAICRGHLTTIPGLTTNLISKHLPKSIAITTLAHQDQEAKHLRSTRSIVDPSTLHSPPQVLLPIDSDLAPSLEPKSHQLCAMPF
jgi:hypothetical protein